MRVLSRRRFLGSAAAAPFAVHPHLAGLARAALPFSGPMRHDCLLVDGGEHCALPESLAGFARALEAGSISHRRVTFNEIDSAALIVIPGALLRSVRSALALRNFAELGSIVLYESGAAYAGSGEFETEQRLLQEHFGVKVKAPIGLWPKRAQGAPPGVPPYIHYHWPSRVTVRDFSRVLPLSAVPRPPRNRSMPEATYVGATEAIAAVRGVSACCRTQQGDGEFIFLGSPLGPHLGTGDREARALFTALLSRRLRSGSPVPAAPPPGLA